TSKVSPEAMAVLVRYRWPGNVRELENVIYRSAVIAQGDTILLKDLPVEVREAAGVGPAVTITATVNGTGSATPFEGARTASAESSALATAQVVAESIASGEPALSVERALDFLHTELSQQSEPIMERLEREMIVRVLAATEGNLLKASEKLGMTRATLRKRVDELGLKT
ncbi:MAG: helix-turn-helix domain-containing protein, partial [Rariglobus sp.]